MKKIALSLILACGVAMAAEANATDTNTTAATAAEANATDTNATAAAGANGAALFAKCVSCHGKDAGKKALGKSEVIKGWAAAKVEEALLGYKAGTRNVHGMGGVMKGQVASMSDEDIKALAAYVSSLK